MIGGASVRGCKAADYSCKTSTCEGQKLGVGPKSPSSPLPWFRRPCTTLYNYYLFAIAYKKVYKNCFCICYDARQLRSLQLTNYITVYCLQTSVTMIHKHPLHKINFFLFLPCIFGILLYFMDALGGVADCAISEEKQLPQKSRKQWLLKDVL